MLSYKIRLKYACITLNKPSSFSKKFRINSFEILFSRALLGMGSSSTKMIPFVFKKKKQKLSTGCPIAVQLAHIQTHPYSGLRLLEVKTPHSRGITACVP